MSSPGSPQGSGKPPLPVMCLPSCRTQAAGAPAADGGPTLLLLLGTRIWMLAGTGAGEEACRHQPNFEETSSCSDFVQLPNLQRLLATASVVTPALCFLTYRHIASHLTSTICPPL